MQLEQLKKSVEESRNSLARYRSLIKKREALWEEFQALKESIEHRLIQMHRFRKEKSKKALEIEEEILDQSDRVAKLTQALREIDHQLDELGEDHDTKHEQLKQELIAQIHLQSTQAAEEYQVLEKRLKIKKENEKELKKQKELLSPFYRAMKEGVKIPLKRGILGFLYGRNPKALLAEAIHHAQLEGKKILQKVENDQFKTMLEAFIKDADKPWNSSLYSGKFTEYFKKFSVLMDELEKAHANTIREILKEENEIEKWIETYSQNQSANSQNV